MKFATYAFTVLLSFAAGTLTANTMTMDEKPSRIAAQSNSAPFRDGLYLGKLAAKEGRQPHVASGRWNSEADRAAFIEGYGQGYRQLGE